MLPCSLGGVKRYVAVGENGLRERQRDPPVADFGSAGCVVRNVVPARKEPSALHVVRPSRQPGFTQQTRGLAVREQWTALKRKLLGHFGYFGITGNFRALRSLRHRVRGVWRKWLSRRSQRARISWENMNRLLERYPLPQPRIRYSPVT